MFKSFIYIKIEEISVVTYISFKCTYAEIPYLKKFIFYLVREQ